MASGGALTLLSGRRHSACRRRWRGPRPAGERLGTQSAGPSRGERPGTHSLMTQILPFAEPRTLKVYGQFERGVYDAPKA